MYWVTPFIVFNLLQSMEFCMRMVPPDDVSITTEGPTIVTEATTEPVVEATTEPVVEATTEPVVTLLNFI